MRYGVLLSPAWVSSLDPLLHNKARTILDATALGLVMVCRRAVLQTLATCYPAALSLLLRRNTRRPHLYTSIMQASGARLRAPLCSRCAHAQTKQIGGPRGCIDRGTYPAELKFREGARLEHNSRFSQPKATPHVACFALLCSLPSPVTGCRGRRSENLPAHETSRCVIIIFIISVVSWKRCDGDQGCSSTSGVGHRD